ncbi:MAG TPA: DUF4190 domain-containing protein [Candidatus Dormibacteraeota bacterium]|nr:DUF4190 domain-containing protein [Candidatus Dormibacteraeota bacterium]
MNTPTADIPGGRVEGRAVASLVLGAVSLIGLVMPPLLAAGIAGIYLGWTARRRIKGSLGVLRGTWVATLGLVLGIIGCLLSLVLPGFVIAVYIYAAFHGGQIYN